VHMVEAIGKLARDQRQMRDPGREPTPEELAVEVQRDDREAEPPPGPGDS
jgi:DNA-directed RNA polymerase sigma subunit (sigma70/sigma32)